MKAIPLAIPEVILIEPRVFQDDRGYFFESYNERVFNEIVGKVVSFVQDNHSKSKKNVLRGVHYQLAPQAQGKLVRAIVGEVFDIAVDLRRSSPTFGSWVGEILSAENKKQLWIPQGFGHAFLTLSENAEFIYKTTAPYSAEHDRCILWSDRDINIRWPISMIPIVSEKDSNGSQLKSADLFI
jgi:dTDP-4-dehydrorhamnose 3,5-epimerase